MEKLALIEKRYNEINELLANPEVSMDYSRVQGLIKEQTGLRQMADLYREYRDVTKALKETQEVAWDEGDRELAAMARLELPTLEEEKERIEREMRVALLPSDPNDEKNVIMEIRAGTGGEEAGLFASDLFRMYSRYAQRMGWKTEVLSSNETGLGSIKEIVFLVEGEGAYSKLKHESGTHRVQRIPLTESGGRIHTSAATVAVLPEAEEVDIDIRPDDIQIDIFHAGGHGGQNVQKVATAVRITHKPSGLVAICQDERSQHKNKEKAMAVLRSRVLAQEVEKQEQEISADRRAQVGSGDRSERVRTYNFPQDRVTDHRIGLTIHNMETILAGDIDRLIDTLMTEEQAAKLESAGV